MNEDVFAGQWKQMRGELKGWWGKLTDDDFDKIGGQKDKLIGLVQERYGYARNEAQDEVARRFNEYSENMAGGMGRVGSKAQELGATVASRANDAANVAGEKMDSLAGVIRKNAPRVVETATTLADGLESASSYLQDKPFQHLAKDFTGLVRTYPIQSLLVGFGLGYILARRPNKA
ncbi:MAG: CsbD family protein [Candidatus Binatia bacterium]